MIGRVELNERPPEPVRLVWCDWLRHHTIDPSDVAAAAGWLEVDYDTHRISYLSYDLDEHGARYYDPDKDDVAKVVRVVQLEARPSPFPDFAPGASRRWPIGHSGIATCVTDRTSIPNVTTGHHEHAAESSSGEDVVTRPWQAGKIPPTVAEKDWPTVQVLRDIRAELAARHVDALRHSTTPSRRASELDGVVAAAFGIINHHLGELGSW